MESMFTKTRTQNFDAQLHWSIISKPSIPFNDTDI